MMLLLRFVTGDGILLFEAYTYLMFYQRKSMFFSMNALSLNLRVTSFENHFLRSTLVTTKSHLTYHCTNMTTNYQQNIGT